jgi:hypothetical protein
VKRSPRPRLLILAISCAALLPMCGGGSGAPAAASDAGDDGSLGVDPGGDPGFDVGGESGADATHGFDVQPSALQTILLAAGTGTPTVDFTATLDGAPANAAFSLDRGDVGTITPSGSTATFTPKGTAGGLVTVRAGLNGTTLSRQIFVQLGAKQNGASAAAAEQSQLATSVAQLRSGGGVGGVGGEGLGGPVTDAAALAALTAPSSDGSAQGLKLLYPYDKTLWPRGLRAPLMMWNSTLGDVDAIRLTLVTASRSFSWTGTFAKPAILATSGGKFVRHPIPQDVWDMATNTAGGPTPAGTPDTLTVSLTVEKGGQAYGPIQQTWRVAPARLTGTVYYNSYGTQLVKNWTALDKAGHAVGAAILGVRSGDTGPKLVVGKDSPLNAAGKPADDSGCRVCHVVASRGRWLLTQSEQGTPGDGRSYLYDLTAANVQGSVAQIPNDGVFGWAAMTGDGARALTNAVDPSSTNPTILGAAGGGAASSFWSFGATPATATSTGLPSPLGAGYPSYSPDDKKLTYVDATGTTQNVTGPIMMADYDASTRTFSAFSKLHAPAAGQRLGYPVFLPDDSGVVFETQVRSSQSDSVVVTRNGARSEIWLAKPGSPPTVLRLDMLNGRVKGVPYLPIGPNNHGNRSRHPRRVSDAYAASLAVRSCC